MGISLRAATAVLILHFLFSSALAECVPPLPGMVGWWAGDGDASDLSGNGNDGTPFNGVAFATGHVEQAFIFDGANNYVTIPGAFFSGLATGSIAAWVKGDNTVLSTLTNSSNNRQFPITWSGGRVFVTGVTATGSHTLLCRTVNSFDVGQFHHIVYTSGGGLKIYVDGNDEAVACSRGSSGSNFYYSTTMQAGDNLQIAAKSDGGFVHRDFYSGLIDELQIYNRPLSLSDVQAIHGAGTDGVCKTEPTKLIDPNTTFHRIFFQGGSWGPNKVSEDRAFINALIEVQGAIEAPGNQAAWRSPARTR